MIKVLIVDDSRVVQQFMSYILSSDPEIKIVGIANSGEEALNMASKLRPNVITMDIHMPGMDGYEATRAIMEVTPTPVVIVSGSLSVSQTANAFKLFEVGALAVVLRPPGMEDSGFSEAHKQLIQTVKLMSQVKVVRRFPNQSKIKTPKPLQIEPAKEIEHKKIKLIAIGASTGGPVVLKTILSNLPKDLSVPVVIVQHIAKGFVNGLCDWLSISSGLPVKVAANSEILQAGQVYIAPDGYQMGVSQENGQRLKVKLESCQSITGICPSVDHLFHSVADEIGSGAIGVLLTGMGKDGAKELKRMKDSGAVTVAQDEASSVIFGMPGEAVKIGAAGQILPADKIAGVLIQLVLDV